MVPIFSGHPLFYAAERHANLAQLSLKEVSALLQWGYYAAERHANLALLSLKGINY
jgi:hypothetical protein